MMTSANSLSAATVAHWDFETDLIAGSAVSGQTVSHPSATGAFDAAIADISGNGNDLSAFAQDGGFTAMLFSNNVAPVNRTNTTLSIENAPGTCCPVLSSQDDLEIGGVNVGAMSAWTIEATVNFKNLGAWRTVVGKDGVGQATNGDLNQAPLYFQKKGDGTQQFRINYVDVAGYGHVLDSTTAAVANQWYHIVATNDGSTMKLFVNNVLESSLDLTASPSTNLAMAALDEAGFEGTGTTVPYAWSVARGMYNDGHGDRVDGYIDDVRISNLALDPSEFLNRPPDLLPSTLRINRDTGAMTLLNQQTPVQIVGYSITSTAGSLNSANWQPIANNFDTTSGGEFDTDDEWTVLSAAGSKTDFSEFVFDTTPGDGAALGSSFQIPIGAAGAWRKSIFEDVQAVLKKSDGSSVTVNIEYTGNGGQPFDRSDLNFDGLITGADWVIFRTNNLVSLSSMSLAEAYAKGDLDGDHDNDFGDFVLFKADYEAFNPGAGSFARMIASVPEPATLGMLLAGLLLVGCRRDRRRIVATRLASATGQLLAARSTGRLVAAMAAAVMCLLAATSQAARTHTYTFNDGNVNDTTGTANGAVAGAATVNEFGLLNLPGGAADFATLPAATIAINTYTDVTFEGWFTRTGAGGAWQRLFDFGNTNASALGTNYIFYTPNSGPGDNRAAISTLADPGYLSEEVVTGGPVVTANVQHHVVVRFDNASNGGAGTMDLFLDGALVGSSPITKQLSDLSNAFAYLGESTYTGDTNLFGSINEFRIYNHALTNTEVTDNAYFGATPSDLLGIEVNKSSGVVTIKNNHSSALTIDHYSIVSRGGALNNSWSGLGSLDSVGAGEGQSWSKAGGASANELAELFLLGESQFDPDEFHSIGTAYNPAVFGANNGDLVFQYHLSTGERLYGPVTYLSGLPVSGDYNGNGVVDAADYTYWRDRLGQNSPLPNTNPADVDGVVTQAEYTYWKSRFGATSGSGGGGVAGSSAVPEPTAMLLITLGAGVGLVASGRRSRISTPQMRDTLKRATQRRDTMSNTTKGFGVRSIVSALLLVAVVGATASAATKDRFYQFGDDTVENPVVGNPPQSDFGPFSVDSVAIGPNDFSDVGYTSGPVYVNTNSLGRPGSAAGELGLTFNGTDNSLFRANGGLGSPAIGDDDAVYAGNPNYTGITTRLIDGWVRPTNLTLGRQDIINDTAQFGVFISADDKWSLVHGATTITSTTAVTANAWAHVMHRTFTNTAGALYVNGVAIAATNNDYNAGFNPATSAKNIVFGADVDQAANFFAGQLDNFSIYVAGNNSAQTNGANWGETNLATDNDYIRQQLVGKLAGDVNLSGGAPNATDVSVFVANWLSTKVVNGVTVGDITTRTKGDFDFDGVVDLDDAFTLHAALLGAGAGGLDFSLLGSGVPEPSSLLLAACGCAALAIRTRRQLSEPGRGHRRAAMVGPRA